MRQRLTDPAATTGGRKSWGEWTFRALQLVQQVVVKPQPHQDLILRDQAVRNSLLLRAVWVGAGGPCSARLTGYLGSATPATIRPMTLAPLPYRIGYGEDAHRLSAGRSLVLGGVTVPAERGAVAHSDGDVILHALSDALLAGVAAGDIGQYFPDTDAAWKDLDSAQILTRALDVTRERGYTLAQLSLVVTLDQPRLGPLRAEIAAHVAALCGLAPGEVGLSFKTSERLAPDHVQARVTVLLLPEADHE